MKRQTLAALVLVGVLGVAGCANSPSSIAPTAVDSDEYSHLNCQQLTTELATVSAKLSEAKDEQNSAQTGDAITVFLFLVPLSALTGDAEADVAQYKGEKLAIERAMAKKDC